MEKQKSGERPKRRFTKKITRGLDADPIIVGQTILVNHRGETVKAEVLIAQMHTHSDGTVDYTLKLEV